MTNAKAVAKRAVDLNLVEKVYEFLGAMDVVRAGVLQELDLTQTQADALWSLREHREPASMRSLAEALRCDPANITFIAEKLQHRGLIVRVAHVTDRRVKLVAATPAGRAIQRRLVNAAATRSPLSRLSASEQRQLSGLLEKMLTL